MQRNNSEAANIKSKPKLLPEHRFLITVASAVLLAFFVSLFVVRLAVVDGDSMVPTFSDGDVMITLPIAYRFDDVERGDAVLIKRESLTSGYIVKRVIALSGETVEIRSGRVYIDGVEIDDEYSVYDAEDNFGPIYVEDGCFFVLGDNRSQSVDSRFWDEPLVNENELKGRVVCKIFS